MKFPISYGSQSFPVDVEIATRPSLGDQPPTTVKFVCINQLLLDKPTALALAAYIKALAESL